VPISLPPAFADLLHLLHLIQEHRREFIVAHALDLTVSVADHQFRVYLIHFFSNQSVLDDAIGIRSYVEAYGTQSRQSPRGAHQSRDVCLVSFRGARVAQLAIRGAGQNINEAGQQITRRNLNIQPTVEVAPGSRLNIFATKDLVLPLHPE
jgi:hypothetical protein